jgi:hypothetical protein
MASKKKAAPRAASSSASRAHDVVLQRIESQMQVVVEAVVGMQQQLDTRLTALESRLSDRISILEQVVRQNSEDIRKNSDEIRKNSDDIRKNSEDIRELREEVALVRRDFERREELARVRTLEERVARMEAKLGIAS